MVQLYSIEFTNEFNQTVNAHSFVSTFNFLLSIHPKLNYQPRNSPIWKAGIVRLARPPLPQACVWLSRLLWIAEVLLLLRYLRHDLLCGILGSE